jgi:hypothetical protein
MSTTSALSGVEWDAGIEVASQSRSTPNTLQLVPHTDACRAIA